MPRTFDADERDFRASGATGRGEPSHGGAFPRVEGDLDKRDGSDLVSRRMVTPGVMPLMPARERGAPHHASRSPTWSSRIALTS